MKKKESLTARMHSRNNGGQYPIIPNRREVTVVEILNPLTHDIGVRRKYTDFEIRLKSTSKAFTIPQSSVRRRYSDFVWLRNWLQEHNEGFTTVKKTPRLPPKKLIGRFEEDFILERMKGLQKFLRRVIEHNVFLSDKALHLFLQSSMSIKQIENYLTGKPVEVDGDCQAARHLIHQDDDHVRRRFSNRTEVPSSRSDGNRPLQPNNSPFISVGHSSLLEIPEDSESLSRSISSSMGDSRTESNNSSLTELKNGSSTESSKVSAEEVKSDIQRNTGEKLTDPVMIESLNDSEISSMSSVLNDSESAVNPLADDSNDANTDSLICSNNDSVNSSNSDLSIDSTTDASADVSTNDSGTDSIRELPDEPSSNLANDVVEDSVDNSATDSPSDSDNSTSDSAMRDDISEASSNNIDGGTTSDRECDAISVDSDPECDKVTANCSFLVIETGPQADHLCTDVAGQSVPE